MKLLLFLLLGIFLISFSSAIICNPNIASGCPDEPLVSPVITGANYSINTNYSDNAGHLQGYPASYFYPYSNPLNFKNATKLNEIGNPNASKTFSMGGNTITWTFTNPVGGMLWVLTGGWSGHVLEILDQSSVPNGNVGDHLLHIQTDRINVIAGHFVHNGSGTALLVDGKMELNGNLSGTNNICLSNGTNCAIPDLSNHTTYPIVSVPFRNLTQELDSENIEVYENEFYNTGDEILATTGTLSKSNIEPSAISISPANAIGNDGQLTIFGTGAGTGTTTNTVTTRVQGLCSMYYKGKWSLDNQTWNGTVVIGHYRTTSANDLNTLERGFGFIFNDTITGDRNLYGYSKLGASEQRTAGFTIGENNNYELLITTNCNPVINGVFTNSSIYARLSTNPKSSWTYLGYLDENLGQEDSNFGIWAETQVTATGLNRLTTDYWYVRQTKDSSITS